jgi:hypothetical protein
MSMREHARKHREQLQLQGMFQTKKRVPYASVATVQGPGDANREMTWCKSHQPIAPDIAISRTIFARWYLDEVVYEKHTDVHLNVRSCVRTQPHAVTRPHDLQT